MKNLKATVTGELRKAESIGFVGAGIKGMTLQELTAERSKIRSALLPYVYGQSDPDNNCDTLQNAMKEIDAEIARRK